LTEDEAKEAITELREKETRQQRKLSTIIRQDYLEALEALQTKNISTTLWEMADTHKFDWALLNVFLNKSPKHNSRFH